VTYIEATMYPIENLIFHPPNPKGRLTQISSRYGKESVKSHEIAPRISPLIVGTQ
jgi:hypothetical protein